MLTTWLPDYVWSNGCEHHVIVTLQLQPSDANALYTHLLSFWILSLLSSSDEEIRLAADKKAEEEEEDNTFARSSGWTAEVLLMYIRSCTYVHTYIHTYVHTYIHMYIHSVCTYLCTYICSCQAEQSVGCDVGCCI